MKIQKPTITQITQLKGQNTELTGSFSGSFSGDGSNLTGVLTFNDTTIGDTFTNAGSKIVAHNFGTKNVIVTVYNDLDQVIIPDSISNIDENNISVTFGSATSGRVVVVKGGHLVSGSISAEFNTLTGNPFGYTSGSSLISASGHLIPTVNVTYDIGTENYRWRDIYLSGNTIDLGGTLIKRHNATGKLVVEDSLGNELGMLSTSSYALTASYAENVGGGAGFPFSGSAVITGSLFVSGGVITGDGSGLTNVFPANPAVSASFTNVTTLNYNHGFGTRNIVASVYNTSNQQIFPKQITLTSNDVVDLLFDSPQSGYLVVSSGGNIVEGTTQNALTASYSQNTVSASFATTSNQSTNFNVSSGSIKFWQGNQSEYDGLGTYDNNTIYFVT